MVKIKKLFRFKLLNYIEDILICIGLILINIPFYIYKWFVGIEITGLIFLILGIYFAKNPPKGR
ncbi:hypothetical protein DP124_01295 [Clostridium tetani]|nr:hypothetical protein KY55_01330 [Clostridium tetani]RXI55532.1 hypothetical protein DP124_01295 [Clostridium tetani]RXM71978.1 hypothetical protein DP143_09230 [Clostridium tetani]